MLYVVIMILLSSNVNYQKKSLLSSTPKTSVSQTLPIEKTSTAKKKSVKKVSKPALHPRFDQNEKVVPLVDSKTEIKGKITPSENDELKARPSLEEGQASTFTKTTAQTRAFCSKATSEYIKKQLNSGKRINWTQCSL